MRGAGGVVYFFPLFLIPWPPTLRGPLPAAFLAISSRAFLSEGMSAIARGKWLGVKDTGSLLGLECDVILVLILDSLLGLLVLRKRAVSKSDGRRGVGVGYCEWAWCRLDDS